MLVFLGRQICHIFRVFVAHLTIPHLCWIIAIHNSSPMMWFSTPYITQLVQIFYCLSIAFSTYPIIFEPAEEVQNIGANMVCMSGRSKATKERKCSISWNDLTLCHFQQRNEEQWILKCMKYWIFQGNLKNWK